MAQLKEQTETQREKAAFCEQRLAEMEMQVGMIADTACYKQGFDIAGETVSLQQLGDSFVPQAQPSARLNVGSAGSQ